MAGGWQIKAKRDYLEGRHRTNWFYMSRLAALKEFSYMKVTTADTTTATHLSCLLECD